MIFRVCFLDPFQGEVMAKFAWNTLKAKKVAIFKDQANAYSVGLAEFFEKTYKKMGGNVVAAAAYSAGDNDFKSQLTNIKGAAPDAIFVPGYYTEVGLIARQAKAVGLKVPLLGGDGWDSSKLTEIGGDAIEGSYFSNHYSVENQDPHVQRFIKSYEAQFKAKPDGLAALGYDAMMILADAIKRAGSDDPKKIRDALAATKDFKGVTGAITIDAGRNAKKSAVVLKVEKGNYKFQETIAAE
jgi:branched-chain amino acid transport system substrate-binding protein